MRKYSHQSSFSILITFLTCLIIIGCQDKDPLVNPFEIAQIQIQLEFPGETKNEGNAPKSTNLTGAVRAINDVTISVLDAFSRDIIINQQQLEIVFSEEFNTNVATGELSIPITNDFQSVEMIVFASDAANFLFLVGSTNITLSAGEVDHDPVFISLGAPNLVAQSGTATASSVFEDSFPPSEAIDFDFTTSWFSGGSDADGQTSTYTWNAPGSIFLSVCGIVNNSNHFNPAFRTGFGFDTVTFQVYSDANATGDLVFENTVNFPKGSATPFVKVAPLTFGRSIRLLLEGHEDPTCGGFSELLIVSD